MNPSFFMQPCFLSLPSRQHKLNPRIVLPLPHSALMRQPALLSKQLQDVKSSSILLKK